jgi:hypothetical protein
MYVPSSELGLPPPHGECSLDPKGGEQHSLAAEAVGGPSSDDWKESLALCIHTLCLTCFFRNMEMAYLCRFGAAWAGGGGGIIYVEDYVTTR